MQAEIDVLVGQCDPPCDGRSKAMTEGSFAWSQARHGWIVPDWIRRTPREAYYGVDLVYSDCPWCGLELPSLPDAQDDDCC